MGPPEPRYPRPSQGQGRGPGCLSPCGAHQAPAWAGGLPEPGPRAGPGRGRERGWTRRQRGRLRTQGGQAGEGRALSRDGCSEKATHILRLVFPKLMSVLILFLLGTFWDLPRCLGSCGFGALLFLQGRGPGSLSRGSCPHSSKHQASPFSSACF